MLPIRLPNVRRTLASNQPPRPGSCYISRFNGQAVYFGWDQKKNPGQQSTSLNLEIQTEQALALRDWLIAEFPVIDEKGTAGLRAEMLSILDNFAPPDSSFDSGFPEIPVDFWIQMRSLFDRRLG